MHFLVRYIEQDVAWARWIQWILQKEGYAVDLQPWFQSNPNPSTTRTTVSQECRHVIVIVSSSLNDIAVEDFFVLPREIEIIPVKVNNCRIQDVFPLQHIEYIDLSDDYESEANEKLLFSITQKIPLEQTSKSEQQMLEERRDALQAEWQIAHKKLASLKQAFVIEASPATRFQLEQQIKVEQDSILQLENTISLTQTELSRSRPGKTIPSTDRPAYFPGNLIPFQNRVKEIDKITKPEAQEYHWIIAPEGYGKTQFLKEARKKLQDQQWRCAYTKISTQETPNSLEADLAKSFGLELSSNQEHQEEDLGARLGHLLSHVWPAWEAQNSYGIALLIDLEGGSPPESLLQSLENFRGEIHKFLKDIRFFREKERRFRVVLAGRLMNCSLNCEHTSLYLSTFNWEVIYLTAREYLSPLKLHASRLSLLASHLLYLTGGHPRGIAQGLINFKFGGYALDSFLKRYGDQAWENTISGIVNQIEQTLAQQDENLPEALAKLSIFPILNSEILEESIRNFELPFERVIQLRKKLMESSIFTCTHGDLLKDGIIRRLLTISLLRRTSPEYFRQHCVIATEICFSFLVREAARGESGKAADWAFQFLFQTLQKDSGFINSHPTFRADLRSDLWMKLTEIFSFFEERDTKKVFLESLKNLINESWELKFIFNYYLRDEEYNNDYYEVLIRRIDDESRSIN